MNNLVSSTNAGWLRAIYFILLWFAGGFLFSIPLFFIDGFNDKNQSSEIITLLPQLAATLAAIYICRCIIDRQEFWSIGLSFRLKDFLIGSLAGILFITTGFFLLIGSDWIDASMVDIDYSTMLTSAFLFILVAMAEEFMCRTYFLNALMDSMPKYVAVLVSSLFFGSLHFFNPHFSWIGFINISILGIFMGIWYAYRKNIWFPVGVHLTWNFFQTFYGFSVSGQLFKGNLFHIVNRSNVLLTGGTFGLEGSFPYILVAILGTIGLNFYLIKSSHETQ